MEIDRDKAIKLIIIAIATLAALAVMNVAVQLITTILPFLIVAAGVYAGYRWGLSDTAAPTADEVEEQARGLFSRFRKSKDVVEKTMKVGAMMSDFQDTFSTKKEDDVVEAQVVTKTKTVETVVEEQVIEEVTEEVVEDEADDTEEALNQIKQSIESNPDGQIEFKDGDVVISKDDFIQPDTSRLEEKAKEVPKVTDNVLSQIEERRRRLEQGRNS